MAYVTASECKAEGIDPSTDPRLNSIIAKAQKIVERVTGRYFEPRSLTIKVDGSGTPYMRFDIPIIAITSVKENGVLVDPTTYIVYNHHLSGNVHPDDRDDPRIERTEGLEFPLEARPNWTVGKENYEVTGVFGYTDWDGHDDTVLPYDNQTADFTVGQVVTGAQSGATGTIAADADQGTAGTLTLTGVDGHFEDNEDITDPLGGAAKANVTTHWQGVTPPEIKDVVILYVKRHYAKLGDPMFSAVYLRDAEDGDVRPLPYTITGDRVIDEKLAPFVAPADVEFV